MTENNPVIFYDGVCGLCNRCVQFIIRHDKEKKFRFAALQSDFVTKLNIKDNTIDSLIYYKNGKLFYKSNAVVKIMEELGGIYYFLSIILKFFHTYILDSVYVWVAKNRYKWFGEFDACKIPTPEQKELFIL